MTRIWFTGLDTNEPPRRVVGLMQGACGVDWGNPTVAQGLGQTGTWNESSIGSPFVWKEGPSWKMMAAGRSSSTAPPTIGYWTSDDAQLWEESLSNPLVTKLTGVSTWDSRGVDYPLMVRSGGEKPVLFFSGIPADWRPRLVRGIP